MLDKFFVEKLKKPHTGWYTGLYGILYRIRLERTSRSSDKSGCRCQWILVESGRSLLWCCKVLLCWGFDGYDRLR